jgi:hypothetical protein
VGFTVLNGLKCCSSAVPNLSIKFGTWEVHCLKRGPVRLNPENEIVTLDTNSV